MSDKKIFIVDKDWETYIAETFEEFSKPEYKGIRTLVVMAYTNNDDPITIVSNMNDINAIAILVSQLERSMFAHEFMTHLDDYKQLYGVPQNDWDDGDNPDDEDDFVGMSD